MEYNILFSSVDSKRFLFSSFYVPVLLEYNCAMILKNMIKTLYKRLPYKKNIFDVVRRIYVPGERISRHLYFSGVIDVALDLEHEFCMRHYGYQLENELYWNGPYGSREGLSMQLWSKLCAGATTIFDVGANTGVYSLVAKCLNPSAQVCAFEPVKRVFHKLVTNNDLNSYNIFCVESAASNQSGQAFIFDPLTEHVYSVTVNKDLSLMGVATTPVTVQTVRLDEFMRDQGIDGVDLLKIDVETHEVEVLEGLGLHLKIGRPTLLLEVLNDVVGEGIERLISGMGYLYFNIDDSKHTIKRVEHISASDTFNYLICDRGVADHLGLLECK